MVVDFFLLRQGLIVEYRLTSDSRESSSLSLPSTGIPGMSHHTWQDVIFGRKKAALELEEGVSSGRLLRLKLRKWRSEENNSKGEGSEARKVRGHPEGTTVG